MLNKNWLSSLSCTDAHLAETPAVCRSGQLEEEQEDHQLHDDLFLVCTALRVKAVPHSVNCICNKASRLTNTRRWEETVRMWSLLPRISSFPIRYVWYVTSWSALITQRTRIIFNPCSVFTFKQILQSKGVIRLFLLGVFFFLPVRSQNN